MSMEDKEKKWTVNLDDPAVRSICVAIDGKPLDPYVPPAPPAGAPGGAATAKPDEAKKEVVIDVKSQYMKNAIFATAGSSTLLGMASLVPNSAMVSTFALSCWVGKYSIFLR